MIGVREWTRIDIERHPSPSEAVIDSQSVKSAAMVHEAVGYDAGKQIKGRKRFMTVDTRLTSLEGIGNGSQSWRTRGRKTGVKASKKNG